MSTITYDEVLRAVKPLRAPILINSNEGYAIHSIENHEYIKPDFKRISTYSSYFDLGRKAQIILISASGASGKSELAKSLSKFGNTPLLNLSEHGHVGENSMTGLLAKAYGDTNYSQIINHLTKGNGTIIIDALDEGKLKTTQKAFEGFMKDIFRIARSSSDTSFVLLGRTQVLEEIFIQGFLDFDVNIDFINILPFDEEKSRTYIVKKLEKTSMKHKTQFHDTLNSLLTKIKEFFDQSTTDSQDPAYSAFIGYPPVLDSIVTLFEKEKNYAMLKNLIDSSDQKGIALIITIIEYIMVREQNKVKNQLIPEIANDLTDQLLEKAQTVYSLEEQIERLLSFFTNFNEIKSIPSVEKKFDFEYEKRIKDFFKEHPFMFESKIKNKVFESYLIAKSLVENKNEELIEIYTQNESYKFTHILFYLYDQLSDQKTLSSKFLNLMYQSLLSISAEGDKFDFEVDGDSPEEDGGVECKITFADSENENRKRYEFTISNDQGQLHLNGEYERTHIDYHGDIVLEGEKCELRSPTYIKCKNLFIKTRELVFSKGLSYIESSKEDFSTKINGIVVECESIMVTPPKGGRYPDFIFNESLGIISTKELSHPFYKYSIESPMLRSLDQTTLTKYRHFRRIAMAFRSHSKGGLARYRDKMRHKRMTKDEVGLAVLDALVENNIIKLDNDKAMYFWNKGVADQELEISYNLLRSRQVSDKLISFLGKINV